MAIYPTQTRERLRSLESSLQSRLDRIRKRALSILQVSVAAGIAFWAAQELFAHERPFFAPISVIIVVGFSDGERIHRALDMSLGCVLGVLVGDLLFLSLGDEPWQIAVMIAVAMTVASFFSKSGLVSNQVAIGTVLIATIMPPGSEMTGVDRTLDALVGSTIGLLTVALIPSSALAGVRHELARVLYLASSVLGDVADGLRTGDAERIQHALEEVRGSQQRINALIAAAKQSREASSLSPLMWGSRRHQRSIQRMLNPVDMSVRTVRVLARRAHILTADRDTATPAQIAMIDELSGITQDLADLFEAKSDLHQATEIPELVRKLRRLGAAASMDIAGDKPVLSNYVILAQTRSLVVDLLQVCGMSRDSAAAVLVPTSDTPALPPDLTD
ncbi:FUSC family protein [Corynebacterium uterequi]|nr:FUSC family protein [Corynebacterium uterequi]